MSGHVKVSADSDMPDESQGKVHPKLVEMTPPPGVTLPTLQQPVVLVSTEGKSTEMSRSEITKRPDYVDNFTKATLKVPIAWEMKDAAKLKLNLYYSSGSPVVLAWPLILFQWEQPAYNYGYQFGKIVPYASDGNALLDKNNTPSIVVAALLFKDELDKLAGQYEQIADLVYTVGGAIASSAGHLNSIPHGSFSGGSKSKSKGPGRGGPKGGGKPSKPTTGGDNKGRSGAQTGGAVGGQKGGGKTGKSGSDGSGGKGRTPIKAGVAKGHADDGDLGKATGKKRGPIKTDKTTAGEGKSVKTTSGSKDSSGSKNSEGGGVKGDPGKSTGKDKPTGDAAGGPKSGEGKTSTGGGDSPKSDPAKPAAKAGAQSAPKKSVLSSSKLKDVRKLDRNRSMADRPLSGKEEGQAEAIAHVLDEANNKNALLNEANDAGGVQRTRNQEQAMATLGKNPKYRLKPMKDNYSEYWETTLVSDTAAGTVGSKMRLIFKIDTTSGKFHSVAIVQSHDQG